MKIDHGEELKLCEKNKQFEIDRLIAQHAKELEELRQSMLNEKENAISELMNGHLSEMKAVSAKHESLMTQLNRSFDEQLSKKEQEHTQNVKTLEDSHDRTVDALKQKENILKKEAEKMLEDINRLEARIAILEKDLAARDNQIKSMQ